MALSHPYWSQRFAQVNAKRMATMLEVLKVRLLPSFEGIEDEANAKVDEAWEAMASLPVGEYGPHIDESEAAEMAQDAGREHYLAMSDARQTLINSFAITLYHLWEQQVLSFHRRQVLGFHEPQVVKLLSVRVPNAMDMVDTGDSFRLSGGRLIFSVGHWPCPACQSYTEVSIA